MGVIVGGHNKRWRFYSHDLFCSSAGRRISIKERARACFDNPEVALPVLHAKGIDKSGVLSQAMRPGAGLRVLSKTFAFLTALDNSGYSFVFDKAPMGREFS